MICKINMFVLMIVFMNKENNFIMMGLLAEDKLSCEVVFVVLYVFWI